MTGRALLPPQPPGAALPLAITAEDLMRDVGLAPEIKRDIVATLTYPDLTTAVNAILAASERAIRHRGEPLVRRTVEGALAPFSGAKGLVKLRNVFRLMTAQRSTASDLIWEPPAAKTRGLE